MSVKINPEVLKAIDSLVGEKPKGMPNLITIDYKREHETEVSVKISLFKLVYSWLQIHLIDTPAPDVQIITKKNKITPLGKVIIIVDLFLAYKALMGMIYLGQKYDGLNPAICMGLMFAVVAVPAFCLLPTILMLFVKWALGFSTKVNISHIEALVKRGRVLPSQASADVKGLTAQEIAKKTLSRLPGLIAQLGDGCSCMLAPNIASDALGKPMARIVPGLTPEDIIAVIDTTDTFRALNSGNAQQNPTQPAIQPYAKAVFVTTQGFFRLEESGNGKSCGVGMDYSTIKLLTFDSIKIKNRLRHSIGCYCEGKGMSTVFSLVSAEDNSEEESKHESMIMEQVTGILTDFVRCMQP